uniref:OSJNBb0066J23.12 protein n=1 Tax=Oryza sativa subsp. japonica TaxID=39947 RepID=Q7XVI6_ORYSJ|nr:OSJNBb0066J23.12 [Oryza sativa Japonica Group]
MSRIRLINELAKNAKMTRSIGPKFTSLRMGAIEVVTCRNWARPAQPMIRPNNWVWPNPPRLRSMQGSDGRLGLIPNDGWRVLPTFPTVITVILKL